MSRVSMFNSPLLLGFDQLERTLDRLAKSAEGYPPYNIERIGENGLRITLAVAGFCDEYRSLYQPSPLSANDEVRAATLIVGMRDRALSISSVIPSEKYSLSEESLRLANGRTATDREVSRGASVTTAPVRVAPAGGADT